MNGIHRTQTGRLSLIGALVLIVALAFWLPACSAQPAKGKTNAAGSGQVIATVAGQPVTEAEVRAKASDAFKQLEREYQTNQHQLLDTQLHQTVQDRLLEAEAKAKGVTKEQLLADVKPAEVTDADVDAFYEQNKAQIPRPKEQVAPQIRQYLQQQRQTESRSNFFKQLEAKYKVEYKLEPMRTEVAAAGFPARGPETAPVTIVEFSDFQCPFCSRVVPTLEQVRAKYGDRVRLVFRQFPLGIHPNAQKAAEAALCAKDQGKFWEMHDAMFKDQQGLAVDGLKAKAAAVGLKADEFNACLDSGKKADEVKRDMEAGTQAGVNGTPAMFINGRLISGAVPIDQITTVIDDELSRKGVATASKSK
jgi:protein-disulfide isomerase